MVRARTQAQLETLQNDETNAWFEYLDAIRGQSSARYEEVEPWAWTRLRRRLKAINDRRAVIGPTTVTA